MATRSDVRSIQVNIDDITYDVRTYLQHVEAGDTVVIIKAGQPIAELKPIAIPLSAQRPFGLCAGIFTVPDDFDAPLPDSVLDDFEGV